MNPEGLPIARLFGIEIRISVTWAILIALITLIGAEQATANDPALDATIQWIAGACVGFGFLVSVLAHELAHALVARRRGVPTTTVVLGFIGGLAPLGVQAQRPGDELAIAVAGPLLSLGLGLIVVAAGLLTAVTGPDAAVVAGGLIVVGGLNLLLGILSLLPGLPLDGGRAIRAMAWARSGDLDRATRVTGRIGRLVGWATLGAGVLLALLDRATEGLLVLTLGWLLFAGARTLERRQAIMELLRGIPVRDGMDREVAWVGPHLTIDTFADRYAGENGVGALPVVEHDRVVGVLGARRLQRLGRRRFATTRVEDVMATPPQAPILAPDAPLWEALDTINQGGFDGLAVANVGGALAGVVTRRSLAIAIRDRMAARQARPGGTVG